MINLLTILFIGIVGMSGCISRDLAEKQANEQANQARREALDECNEKYEALLGTYRARLAKLKQLNADGGLK